MIDTYLGAIDTGGGGGLKSLSGGLTRVPNYTLLVGSFRHLCWGYPWALFSPLTHMIGTHARNRPPAVCPDASCSLSDSEYASVSK